MKPLLFIILSIFILNTLRAADEPIVISNFLRSIEKRNATAAIDMLFQNDPYYSPSSKRSIELKTKLGKLLEPQGKADGQELIAELQLGSRVRAFTYLAFFERRPIRFNILVYYTKQEWRVIDFDFNTGFSKPLFEQIDETIGTPVYHEPN